MTNCNNNNNSSSGKIIQNNEDKNLKNINTNSNKSLKNIKDKEVVRSHIIENNIMLTKMIKIIKRNRIIKMKISIIMQ